MQRALTWIATAALAILASAQPLQSSYSPKISASTITAMHNTIPASRNAGSTTVNAIIRLHDATDASGIALSHNIRINTAAGNLVTAVIPLDAIAQLADDPRVGSIDTGGELRPMNDVARNMTGVTVLHQGGDGLPKAYTGEGVLVGIIDTGFDFMHPAFRDADGNCRIISVWDQNGYTGTPPADYGYGAAYDTPEAIQKAAHDISPDTHGTHVAATAVSSADIYGGMAPDADIILVATNRSEAGIADAVGYLLGIAEKQERPIAINLSMGTVLGFKDGSDQLPSMLDGLLDNRAGTIMAIAAGNEGHRNSTIVEHSTTGGTVIDTYFLPPSHMRENIFIGTSAESPFTVTLSLTGEDDATLFTATMGSDSGESTRHENIQGVDDRSFVNMSPVSDADGKPRGISVNLYAPLTNGQRWHLAVSGEPGSYIAGCDYGDLESGKQACTIASSACGHIPVSVGAYVSRDRFINLDAQEIVSGWDVSGDYPGSGKGPSFDGRDKPDMLAPGAYVISAINSYASAFNVQRSDLVASRPDASVTGRNNYWGAMSGTSMATPVVTGIMALWLQADPSLTHEKVREIINLNGKKIDAPAGIQAINASISQACTGNAASLFVHDPVSHAIKITGNDIETLEIYGLDGSLIAARQHPSGAIALPATPICIIRILTPTRCEVVKLRCR